MPFIEKDYIVSIIVITCGPKGPAPELTKSGSSCIFIITMPYITQRFNALSVEFGHDDDITAFARCNRVLVITQFNVSDNRTTK